VIRRGDKLCESLAAEEEDDCTHDIIKDEARAKIKTIASEEDVSIQSENGEGSEEEE
jgi:hypothetical protein